MPTEKFPECFNECICGCGRCSIPHVDEMECPDHNCPFALPSVGTSAKTMKEVPKSAPKFLEIDKCTDVCHMLKINLVEDLRRLTNRHPSAVGLNVSISVMLPEDKSTTITTIYKETAPCAWERTYSGMFVEEHL